MNQATTIIAIGQSNADEQADGARADAEADHEVSPPDGRQGDGRITHFDPPNQRLQRGDSVAAVRSAATVTSDTTVIRAVRLHSCRRSRGQARPTAISTALTLTPQARPISTPIRTSPQQPGNPARHLDRADARGRDERVEMSAAHQLLDEDGVRRPEQRRPDGVVRGLEQQPADADEHQAVEDHQDPDGGGHVRRRRSTPASRCTQVAIGP